MLQLIEGKEEIVQCLRRLEAALNTALRKAGRRDIGYPGDTYHRAPILHDGAHWSHARNSDEGTPRRLNWFGDFTDTGPLQITVEINIPFSTRNDRIGGYFVRDTRTKQIFLAHSGRVGGGMVGVGKVGFLAWTDQDLVVAHDRSGKEKEGIVVAPLGQKADTVEAILRYVSAVADYKAAVRAGKTKTKVFRRKLQEYKDYYDEGRGRRRGTRRAEIDYVTRHGEIVSALQAWRSTRPKPNNARIVKNRLIDLGIEDGGDLVEIYEAKPTAERPSVYTAMGQLFVHGRSTSCRRVIVLPEGGRLAQDLAAALDRHKIEVLRFRFKRKGAEIVTSKSRGR